VDSVGRPQKCAPTRRAVRANDESAGRQWQSKKKGGCTLFVFVQSHETSPSTRTSRVVQDNYTNRPTCVQWMCIVQPAVARSVLCLDQVWTSPRLNSPACAACLSRLGPSAAPSRSTPLPHATAPLHAPARPRDHPPAMNSSDDDDAGRFDGHGGSASESDGDHGGGAPPPAPRPAGGAAAAGTTAGAAGAPPPPPPPPPDPRRRGVIGVGPRI